jgi:3-hydroxyisobutyrate dehydrogenase
MRLGFIGTGNMGNPMAFNLIKAGHHLTVHDLRRETATNLLEADNCGIMSRDVLAIF